VKDCHKLQLGKLVCAQCCQEQISPKLPTGYGTSTHDKIPFAVQPRQCQDPVAPINKQVHHSYKSAVENPTVAPLLHSCENGMQKTTGKGTSFKKAKRTRGKIVCRAACRFNVLMLPVHKSSKTLTPAIA